MGGNLWADYYDTQWDALQTGKINISNIIDTNTITEESGENIPLISWAELTWKDTTGESTSAK